ncbi:MAG: hypothetical protein OEW08_06165 [Gammaproteobacteria bacterium]|nr:hypothetical protein [Gammaproteobacteria bacterium]
MTMTQETIADFDADELAIINGALTQRFFRAPKIELADSELRLDPTSTQLVLCPAAVWVEQGVTFIVFKAGVSKYRCLFYLGPNDQFGTGIEEYTDLKTCVTTLLQVQADYDRDNMTKMEHTDIR